MPGFISGGPLARELIRIGDQVIAAEDDAEPWAYFAADYVFRGPGGDLSFDRASFASLRAACRDLRIVRQQIIVDGDCSRRAPRSPVTSPGSSLTCPSVPSSRLGNTSSGK